MTASLSLVREAEAGPGGVVSLPTARPGLLAPAFELDDVSRRFGSRWALCRVSFKLEAGTSLLLTGHNGSGKSTLLKLINGIYTPTTGRIDVHGRISALLELGAGFHPDFSGRENITINGIILGMTRSEIRARMEEIIAFAELGDFIDEPVRTYSSGMYMRLAFAVATHVDPDILVIDEILAVGDAHFSKKSMARMNEFKASGKTIVLVTHDLATVENWCDFAVWLDGGRVRDSGNPRDVVAHYHRVVAAEEAAIAANNAPTQLERQPRKGPPAEIGRRWGTFEVELTALHLPESFDVRPQDGYRVGLELERFCDMPRVDVEFSLLRPGGMPLWSTRRSLSPVPANASLELVLDTLPLADGSYGLEVNVRGPDGTVLDARREMDRLIVRGEGGGFGTVYIGHSWAEAPKVQLASGS